MKKDFRKPDYKRLAKMLSMVTHLGYLMIVPLIITILGGAFLDGKLGTSPLFLIIGVVIGAGAAFRNLFDFVKTFNK